jgi:site-specific recombinase XerD
MDNIFPKKDENSKDDLTILFRLTHPDLKDSIINFLFDRRSSSKAINTIKYYQRELTKFANFLADYQVFQVSDISTAIIRMYLVFLVDVKLNKPGGVHASFRAIKAFLNWFEYDTEPVNWKNPIKKVKPPKITREPLNPITQEEFSQLIHSCDNTLDPKRNKAILLCLLDTGLRSDEMLRVELTDIDLRSCSIMIHHGKGGKGRVVFFGNSTKRAITAYLKERDDSIKFLWINKDGNPLKYYGLSMLIKRLVKTANTRKITPHDFRRGFALIMWRNGADIITISRLMGHSDLSILTRYLKQTNADLEIAHQKSSPIDHWK